MQRPHRPFTTEKDLGNRGDVVEIELNFAETENKMYQMNEIVNDYGWPLEAATDTLRRSRESEQTTTSDEDWKTMQTHMLVAVIAINGSLLTEYEHCRRKQLDPSWIRNEGKLFGVASSLLHKHTDNA